MSPTWRIKWTNDTSCTLLLSDLRLIQILPIQKGGVRAQERNRKKKNAVTREREHFPEDIEEKKKQISENDFL